MTIYPAIDLKGGKCVRLKQGKFDEVTIHGDDPVSTAKSFADAGATFIHIVDLDGAKEGRSVNSSINSEKIKEIASSVDINIQTGGGIRTMEDIEFKFSLGINRVIIGTAAVNDQSFLEKAVKKYKDRIAVGIDAVDGKVATNAWEIVSEVTAVDLCQKMKALGIKTIIYTDIKKDGMMQGASIESTKNLIDQTNLSIIASGGVSTLTDLNNIKSIRAEGAIIGKAIYLGAINLKEAIDKYQKNT